MFPPSASRVRALLFAACVLASLAASAQVQPAPRHFLWEVVSLTNRAYLFGTVHAGKQAWFPLPQAVEDAFADSEVLVVEADVTNVAAMGKSSSAMAFTPPDSLKEHVPPRDYERFRRQLARYGIAEAQIRQLKPFMAVSVLVFSEWARLGYLPTLGVDSYLIHKAHGELKPVVEIEGVDVQVKLMESLSDAEHRQIFDGTLKALEMELTSEQITGMVNAWQSGDPALMLEIAQRYNENVPGAKEFEEKFVWSRHESMAQKIEAYMNDTKQRHFIAVGSLHLAGPRGLVEMLRNRGYIVRQR